MTAFNIHTRSGAPRESREILNDIEDMAGFVPNVFGLIANSPNALAGIHAMNVIFRQSSFSDQEQEVIALATSVENACGYCVAGHTTFALAVGIDASVVVDMRRSAKTSDKRLEALRHFVTMLVRMRGAIARQEIARFIASGFTVNQVFELLIGIAAKTVTNFASKMARIPVDEAFSANEWHAKIDDNDARISLELGETA